MSSKDRKSLIIVLTDGYDNSSKHSYQEVLNLVEEYPNVKLSIIHIDGRNSNGSGNYCDQYAHLCKNRGDYTVIKETEIIITINNTFRKYY